MGRRITLWNAFGLVIAIGCTPPIATQTVFYERTIDQTALVPPPTGPAASGPLLEEDRIALEATASWSPVAEGGAEGSTAGHAVLRSLLGFRVAAGAADFLETGWSFELASGSWAQPVRANAPDALSDQLFLRSGPQLRILTAGDRSLGLGIDMELLFSSVPYRRDIEERSTSLSACCGSAGDEYVTSTVEQERAFVPFFRGGVFLTGRLPIGLSLTGGVMAQSQPYFFDTKTVEEICTSYDYGPTWCHGEDPDDVDAFEHRPVGTTYLTVGYEIGAVTLLGEIWVNFAGAERIIGPSPLGGHLGLRLTL